MFHYAVSSLIADDPDTIRIKNYVIRNDAYLKFDAGETRMVIGKTFLHSDITWEENTFIFAAVHLGNHNFTGGVLEYTDEKSFVTIQEKIKEAFFKSDVPQLILTMEMIFGSRSYSLRQLFKDGQRKVLYTILESTLDDLESVFRQIYKCHFGLLHTMKDLQIPVPKGFQDPIVYILNKDLEKNLACGDIDLVQIRQLVDELVKGHFSPDMQRLNVTATATFTAFTKKLQANPHDVLLMETVNDLFRILTPLSLEYNLWECQNDYFHISSETATFMRKKAGNGDNNAARWVRLYEELGGYLGVKSR
jgi:hypothetical protein